MSEIIYDITYVDKLISKIDGKNNIFHVFEDIIIEHISMLNISNPSQLTDLYKEQRQYFADGGPSNERTSVFGYPYDSTYLSNENKFIRNAFNATLQTGGDLSFNSGVTFFLTDYWNKIKGNMPSLTSAKNIFDFLSNSTTMIKTAILNCVESYKSNAKNFMGDYFSKFLNETTNCIVGFLKGISLNILSLAKTLAPILTSAVKELIFNPKKLTFGEQVQEFLQKIALGIAISLGEIFDAVLHKFIDFFNTPIGMKISHLIKGITIDGIALGLIIFTRNSKHIKKFIDKLDSYDSYHRDEAAKLESNRDNLLQYMADLCGLFDLEKLKNDVDEFENLTNNLTSATNNTEFGKILEGYLRTNNIKLQYENFDEMKEFLSDNTKEFVF